MYYGTIKNFEVADGPGCRVSLFVSGCRNHCPGCFNRETWDFGYGREYTGETEKDIEYSRNEYFTRMIQELFSDRELVNEIIETGGISQLEEKADLLNSKLIRSVHRHFVR